MNAPDGGGHFESNYLRLVNGGVFVLLVVVGLLVATSGVGSAVFGVAMALVCGCFAIRGLRMGVGYSNDGITVRGFVRTRMWAWSDVRSFDVKIVRVGAMAYRRKVLVIALRNGDSAVLREQNASPKDTGIPSWVENAATALNQQLNQRV